ncbi:MAG TPA: twin-arginine translocase TatA/TatE family subunit [Flavobacterium sp.]|jgi:sec-independent protein translocase protein TatA|nr:twin-arginine translocase TatA/TatE family subunit [Flavobacterium sp.]
MFGIGGGELMFIIFIVLMLFGSDKIPEIARTLGKGLRQLKDATNEIKSEITNSADLGADKSLFDIRSNINAEIEKAKENLMGDTTTELTKAKTDIEEIASGPIKRQL